MTLFLILFYRNLFSIIPEHILLSILDLCKQPSPPLFLGCPPRLSLEALMASKPILDSSSSSLDFNLYPRDFPD